MLTIPALRAAIAEHAAIRRVRRLQPAGGVGDKLFPPTYPGERRDDPPQHVFERRRIDGCEIWCVLIDSVQSQANRMEEALLAAATERAIPLPYVTVDFRGAELEPLEEITSLDAPAPSIRRHHSRQPARRRTVHAERAGAASRGGHAGGRNGAAGDIARGAAVRSVAQSGRGGGLGAKFPRAFVSEIMGIDTPIEAVERDRRTGRKEAQTAGRRTGSRIDPLGVLRRVEVYKSPTRV